MVDTWESHEVCDSALVELVGLVRIQLTGSPPLTVWRFGKDVWLRVLEGNERPTDPDYMAGVLMAAVVRLAQREEVPGD